MASVKSSQGCRSNTIDKPTLGQACHLKSLFSRPWDALRAWWRCSNTKMYVDIIFYASKSNIYCDAITHLAPDDDEDKDEEEAPGRRAEPSIEMGQRPLCKYQLITRLVWPFTN
jgi:hypothetical protein